MSDINPILLRETLSQYAPQGRTALLPALHAVQTIYGYLPETVAVEVGRALGVPLADVHGVIKFYNLFYPEPVGKNKVQICTDPACAMAGGEEVLQAVREHLASDRRRPLQATSRSCALPAWGCASMPRRCWWVRLPSAGRTPRRRPSSARAWLPTQGLVYGEQRRLTVNCGRGRPTTLAEYEASGGYHALRRAFKQSSAEVIAEVKASGLVDAAERLSRPASNGRALPRLPARPNI